MRPLIRLLAIGLSVVPVAACSSGSPATSSAPTVSASAVTGTPRPAAAPTLSADEQVKLVAWFQDSAHKQGMGVLDRGLDRFTRGFALDSGGSSGFSNIRSACNDLDHDLAIIKDFAPVPEPSIQALWSSAITNLRQGATDCLAGATAGDPAQVAKAKSTLAKGETDYEAAVARLGASLGVTPSPTPS
ncbi:hypothetical protein ACIRBX_33925 [Kitasatospora sp. NPDC096147]|uniref:hypothetical protein n=1 Tax=Kitasatospora sp. NPDC096147 TaxID=3364093 RepID=UPI0037F2EE7F